jgi:hypothetical protein
MFTTQYTDQTDPWQRVCSAHAVKHTPGNTQLPICGADKSSGLLKIAISENSSSNIQFSKIQTMEDPKVITSSLFVCLCECNSSHKNSKHAPHPVVCSGATGC